MDLEISNQLDALTAQFTAADYGELEQRLRFKAAVHCWTGDPLQQPSETVLAVAQAVLRDRERI